MFTGQRGEASDSSLVSRQGSREGEAAAVPQQAAAALKDAQDSPMRRSESRMKAMLRDEVLINAQKFKIQVYNKLHLHMLILTNLNCVYTLMLNIFMPHTHSV